MDQIIQWDEAGKKDYESGVEKGVIYPINENGVYSPGEAWSGLTNVTEKPSGAEPSKIWADNTNYATLYSAEEYGLSVEAYMYPDSFANCDGTASPATGARIGQQPRKVFGFSYVSGIGNDENENAGYKINLVWGCKASPSEKSHATRNDSPEPGTMSWEISSTPVKVTGYKDSCNMELDSRKIPEAKMAEIESILYGTKGTSDEEDVPARLPLPDEIIGIINRIDPEPEPEPEPGP